jgi:hypothetical protein
LQVVDEEVLTVQCAALVNTYLSLERDQLDRSLALAQCIQQIVQRGGHRLDEGAGSRTALWSNLLSCAFIGRHDTDPECKVVWEATWESALSASGAGTKLSALMQMLPNVLELVRAMCLERSWHRRAQAIRVLRDVISSLPEDIMARELSAIPVQVTGLLRALLGLLPGPIWTGQAAVLEAISELMSKYPSCIEIAGWNGADLANLGVLHGTDSVGGDRVTVAEVTSPGLLQSVLDSLDTAGNTAGAERAVLPEAGEATWRMNLLGWVVVLVHEARRGNKGSGTVHESEYRLAAAHAVSLLPWQRVCATPAGVRLFLTVLPLLFRQCGIPPFGVIQSTAADAVPASDSATKAETNRRNKRTLGNAALFGVRYGASKESAPRARTAPRAASADILELIPDNSVVMGSDAGPQQNLEASVPDDANASDERAAQTEEEQDMDVEVGADRDFPAGGEASPVAMEGTTPTGPASSEATPTAPNVEYTHKHPPVYFLSFLDALTRAWPTAKVPLDGSTQDALTGYAAHVLSWADIVTHSEVWSVRRAALQLLGTLCSAGHVPGGDSARVLTVIEAGIQEAKYAKVRVEALRTLMAVLQSPLRSAIDADATLKDRVREVIRTASADSQPTILEAVAKVQNVWLS